MKLIRTITEQDIDPDFSSSGEGPQEERSTARAIVFDNEGRVALLHVSKHDYYKLPGGGVEDGEDVPTALERELLEEIGCTAEVTGEVGRIIEHHEVHQRAKQTSDCFLARQTGEKRQPEFTESEIEEGFEVVWAADIDEAIKLTEEAKPENRDGKFKRLRELTFLRAAKELI